MTLLGRLAQAWLILTPTHGYYLLLPSAADAPANLPLQAFGQAAGVLNTQCGAKRSNFGWEAGPACSPFCASERLKCALEVGHRAACPAIGLDHLPLGEDGLFRDLKAWVVLQIAVWPVFPGPRPGPSCP